MARRIRIQFPGARHQEFEVGLAQIGQTLDDAAVAPNTISWKLELAYRLRQASAPPYSWIAKTLRMGAASSVRAALSRRLQQPAGDPIGPSHWRTRCSLSWLFSLSMVFLKLKGRVAP